MTKSKNLNQKRFLKTNDNPDIKPTNLRHMPVASQVLNVKPCMSYSFLCLVI